MSNALARYAVEYKGVVRAETASGLVFAVLVPHAFVCISGLFEVEFLQSGVEGFMGAGSLYFDCGIFVVGTVFRK